VKASQLGSLLEKYVDALSIEPSGDVAHLLKRLASLIGEGTTQPVSKLLEKVQNSQKVSGCAGHRSLAGLVPALRRLLALLEEAGAKKAALTDVQLLLDLLQRSSDLTLENFESISLKSVASASRGKSKPGEQPVDTDQLIGAYLKKLEAALGNDAQFQSVHSELSQDTRISKSEAVVIASKFFQPVAPSTSRLKALQMVLRRHEKLMESRAASSSIGGKAA
jgi:hypothetical protein